MGLGTSRPALPSLSKYSKVIVAEVKEAPVVIYTKHHCPYCVRAKNEFHEDGIEYVEKNLNEKGKADPDNVESYVKGLIDLTKQRTVPQIFICGKFIGGYTEMHAMRDRLPALVARCSAKSTDGEESLSGKVRPKL